MYAFLVFCLYSYSPTIHYLFYSNNFYLDRVAADDFSCYPACNVLSVINQSLDDIITAVRVYKQTAPLDVLPRHIKSAMGSRHLFTTSLTSFSHSYHKYSAG